MKNSTKILILSICIIGLFLALCTSMYDNVCNYIGYKVINSYSKIIYLPKSGIDTRYYLILESKEGNYRKIWVSYYKYNELKSANEITKINCNCE